jgi:RNA polymerase sigma factor (sigma-70 family)
MAVAIWNARPHGSLPATGQRGTDAAAAERAPAETEATRADAAAIAAVARGDLEALAELYDRHAPALERTLARWGVPASDVNDLVQAIFLEIVRAAPRFDPAHPARAWLFGVAHIMARRHRRSLARAVVRVARWRAATPDRMAPPPSEAYEGMEASRRFEVAFAKLSRKKREVLVLVTAEGLSGQEAARALGIPVKTVWTRLHHARIELREALGEEGS